MTVESGPCMSLHIAVAQLPHIEVKSAVDTALCQQHEQCRRSVPSFVKAASTSDSIGYNEVGRLYLSPQPSLKHIALAAFYQLESSWNPSMVVDTSYSYSHSPACRSKRTKNSTVFEFVPHMPTQVQSGTKGPTTSGGRGKWSQTRLRCMGHMTGMIPECDSNDYFLHSWCI